MSQAASTVFIVDDDASVLKSLSRLVRSAKLSSVAYSSPREFLDRYDPQTPGCLVLDVAMPGLDGLQLQQALTAKGSEIPIIFLTGHGDIPMSVRAMKHGAIDFLTKPVNADDLLKAIRVAMERDQASRQTRAELDDIRQRESTLTPRELEVMQCMVSGASNKRIARFLSIAEKTVKVHRARVMEKMAVRSMAELVRLCSAAGIAPTRVT
jgi:FixJ family two-component response regulator